MVDKDLATKTFQDEDIVQLDEKVNKFRKQYIVRFVQAYGLGDKTHVRVVFYEDELDTGKATVEQTARRVESGYDEQKLKVLEVTEPKTKYQSEFLKSIIESYKDGRQPSEKQKPHFKKAMAEMGLTFENYFK